MNYPGSSLKPEILPTDTAELFDAAVQRSAVLLRAGELVALPTETVYGLAANALDPRAVQKIFQVKGRSVHNPIIVHVASVSMVRRCVSGWPNQAEKLGAAFWPGPLTLVLPRSQEIPDVVTAGGETVGIRWPNHPFMRAVILACGFPLAAPSANPSNQVSPTTAEHVLKGLGDAIPLIIDGGACQVGIESTVLDLTESPPRVLRPGMISAESLSAVTGEQTAGSGRDNGRDPPRSPGLLLKHYAPKARLVILHWRDETDLSSQLSNFRVRADKVHLITHTNIPANEQFRRVSVIPHDAEAFGRAIYAELHRCDEAGADLIVVESLPTTVEWKAIADRLKRAAA